MQCWVLFKMAKYLDNILLVRRDLTEFLPEFFLNPHKQEDFPLFRSSTFQYYSIKNSSWLQYEDLFRLVGFQIVFRSSKIAQFYWAHLIQFLCDQRQSLFDLITLSWCSQTQSHSTNFKGISPEQSLQQGRLSTESSKTSNSFVAKKEKSFIPSTQPSDKKSPFPFHFCSRSDFSSIVSNRAASSF